MSVMMIALSGCQTSAKTGGFTSYDEHYQKNETTLKEDALSDRWESRGSKVAVVSKEKADNNDYPEAKEVLLVNNTKNKVIVSQKVFDQAYNKDHDSIADFGEFKFKSGCNDQT